MDSMEINHNNTGPETAKEKMDHLQERTSLKKRKNKNKWKCILFQNTGCLRLTNDVPVAEKQDLGSTFNVEAEIENDQLLKKTHLIVMVNGIIGSAQNWRFVAKQFVKAHPNNVIVHCSESNSSMLTFDGVDVMGKRLADEVISVVHRQPRLQKISFVGHSLGGLVARYAIAILYQRDLERKCGEENGENIRRGTIAGLEPMNFITSATPHLGSRGHKQVPVFCGFYTMEKAAARSSWLLGRTGKHLFLCDADNGKSPLLLQMSRDSDDLKFISALQSFKVRVAYANARFDHMVGWSSSSLRRRHDLPKRRNLVKIGKYRHLFVEQSPKTVNDQQDALDNTVSRGMTGDMEESMLRGLTEMPWERFDVNFSGSIQQLLAHNTIQVKTYCINYHGADVIQHMLDNFRL